MPATENDFVIALAKSINDCFEGARVYRPHDSVTLGVPDLLAWIPVDPDANPYTFPPPFSLAVEAKQLLRYLKDPLDAGRRVEPLLHHPFSGPQISFLRGLTRAGVKAWGIVRVTSDAAFRIEPGAIPASGNFTHQELVAAGVLIGRGPGGWRFWE
jgi:hypothetical protein